jgi:hypothetical protein
MAWRTALLNFDGKRGHMMVDDRFADTPPVDQLPHLAWFGVYCQSRPVAASGIRLRAVNWMRSRKI